MRFKGGTRATMNAVERSFARIYDRLRKRAQRQRANRRGISSVYDVYHAEGYYEGARDALDEVGELLEREDIDRLAELRGAGV